MPISKERVEDERGRFYRVPNWLLEQRGLQTDREVWLPSVSTILEIYHRPGLMYWYGKMGLEEALRIRDDTGNVGTQVHALIERIIEGERIFDPEWLPLDNRVKQGVRAYVRWIQEQEFRPEQSEQTVYSLTYRYAGTLDAIGTFGPKRIPGLADWKTSARFWKINNLQLAAYRVAYHEMYEEAPRLREIHCARFDRGTGIPEDHPLSLREARTAFYCFLALRKTWDYLKRRPEIE